MIQHIHIDDMADPVVTPSLAAWREGPADFPCPLTPRRCSPAQRPKPASPTLVRTPVFVSG